MYGKDLSTEKTVYKYCDHLTDDTSASSASEDPPPKKIYISEPQSPKTLCAEPLGPLNAGILGRKSGFLMTTKTVRLLELPHLRTFSLISSHLTGLSAQRMPGMFLSTRSQSPETTRARRGPHLTWRKTRTGPRGSRRSPPARSCLSKEGTSR